MTPALLHSYSNGGYDVSLYADGTKVRSTVDEARPPKLPEHFDLKLTAWCDGSCPACHEQSTTKGTHGDVDATLALIKHMPAGSEVAIGGGDPLSHPDFVRFVRSIRAQGLVPSVTVNGRHFSRHRKTIEMLISEGSLFGVGFSYYNELPDWDYEHLVVHLIAGTDSPAVLDAATRSYKVLILGYKQFGRGKKLFEIRKDSIQATIDQWYRELFTVARAHHLSFDNLAIEQLKPQRLFKSQADYEAQHMGDEGLFSMYIDAVTQQYALSSYSPERMPWSDLPTMFADVRRSQGFAVAS